MAHPKFLPLSHGFCLATTGSLVSGAPNTAYLSAVSSFDYSTRGTHGLVNVNCGTFVCAVKPFSQSLGNSCSIELDFNGTIAAAALTLVVGAGGDTITTHCVPSYVTFSLNYGTFFGDNWLVASIDILQAFEDGAISSSTAIKLRPYASSGSALAGWGSTDGDSMSQGHGMASFAVGGALSVACPGSVTAIKTATVLDDGTFTLA